MIAFAQVESVVPTQPVAVRTDAGLQGPAPVQSFGDSLHAASQSEVGGAKASGSKLASRKGEVDDCAQSKGSDSVSPIGPSVLSLLIPSVQPLALPQSIQRPGAPIEPAGTSQAIPSSVSGASFALPNSFDPKTISTQTAAAQAAVAQPAVAKFGVSQPASTAARDTAPSASAGNTTVSPANAADDQLRARISSDLAAALAASIPSATPVPTSPASAARANVQAASVMPKKNDAPPMQVNSSEPIPVETEPVISNVAAPVVVTPQVAQSSVAISGAGAAGTSKSVSKPSVDAVTGKDGSKADNKKNDGTVSQDSSTSQSSDASAAVPQASSSGGQSSHDGAAHDQGTVPVAAAIINHPVAAVHDHSSSIPTVTQPSTQSSVTTASAAKSATPAPAAAPTSAASNVLPAITSAKLIQSIGQSEMRVGMQSAEFGNISIHTSTASGVVSAQISLDHGELAKALASHLPEMQSRLGSDQAMDIRISNTAQAGVSSGLGESSGEAQYQQQQGTKSTSGYSTAVQKNQYAALPTATSTSIGRGPNGRLSIQA